MRLIVLAAVLLSFSAGDLHAADATSRPEPVNPFFDVGYRLVAIALSFWCGRDVWYGLVERKITLFTSNILDFWTPRQILHRDTAPVRYWIIVCTQSLSTVLCFVAAIVGWWQPNS